MIKKAVILAAGRGTRFYPVSKHTSKEVVLLDTTPMIAYLLEELATAGVGEVCLITSLRKADLNWAFEFHAQNLGLSSFTLYQQKPLGTAGALWLAKEWIGEEAFFLYYADDLWIPPDLPGLTQGNSRAQQLLWAYLDFGAPVLSLMEVPLGEVDRFGIVGVEQIPQGIRVAMINRIVEKPSPQNAPSQLAVISGMILGPNIFEEIQSVLRQATNSKETFLTEALDILAKKRRICGLILQGEWVDVGTLKAYPKAFERITQWNRDRRKASDA